MQERPSLSYKIRCSLAFYVKAFLVMFLTAYFSSMDMGIAFSILLYKIVIFFVCCRCCWLIWLRWSLDFLCFDQGRNRAGPREPRPRPPFVVYYMFQHYMFNMESRYLLNLSVQWCTSLHLRELQSQKFSWRRMLPNLPRKARRWQSWWALSRPYCQCIIYL